MDLEAAASATDTPGMAIARLWSKFLQEKGALCPNACCSAIRGRTLLRTATFFDSLTDEERTAHREFFEKKIVALATGSKVIIGWDGIVIDSPRVKTLNGKAHKARRDVLEAPVNAGG